MNTKIQFTRPLRVGDVLTDVTGGGYFGGMFGRDFFRRSVRVEAIGADWVVLRDSLGLPHFADVDPETLTPYRDSRGGPFPEDI